MEFSSASLLLIHLPLTVASVYAISRAGRRLQPGDVRALPRLLAQDFQGDLGEKARAARTSLGLFFGIPLAFLFIGLAAGALVTAAPPTPQVWLQFAAGVELLAVGTFWLLAESARAVELARAGALGYAPQARNPSWIGSALTWILLGFVFANTIYLVGTFFDLRAQTEIEAGISEGHVIAKALEPTAYALGVAWLILVPAGFILFASWLWHVTRNMRVLGQISSLPPMASLTALVPVVNLIAPWRMVLDAAAGSLEGTSAPRVGPDLRWVVPLWALTWAGFEISTIILWQIGHSGPSTPDREILLDFGSLGWILLGSLCALLLVQIVSVVDGAQAAMESP